MTEGRLGELRGGRLGEVRGVRLGEFCHLHAHMVQMPFSESKSNLKQLSYSSFTVTEGRLGELRGGRLGEF